MRMLTDATVDTAFGFGGIAASTATGAAICSFVPGAGTLAGAAGGFVVGGVYMVVAEIWKPNGKSIKDRDKDALYNLIKK
jgi:hypothetical protein